MKFFFTLFSFFFIGVSSAQSYSFTNYSIAEGLSQTQVKAIAEDENGYLWVGTLGGLSRFNGSTFQNFSTEDGLLNNRITALFSNGKELWIGHQGGITLLKGRKFKTWSFGEKYKNISVSKILKFRNKMVFTSNGNGLYVLENDVLRAKILSSDDENRIRSCVIHEGKLFLATRAGLIQTNDLNRFTQIKADIDFNLTGICNKDNKILVCNYISEENTRIFEYDPSNHKLSPYTTLEADIYLNSCFLDSKGNFWSACANGLIFKRKNVNYELISESIGLPFNSCNTVYEDKNGTIWIGSDGKGLFRFAGTHMVYFDKGNGISSELITSSLEKDKQHLIFGTYDKGLISFNKTVFTDIPFKSTNIWASVKDKNNVIWVGTNDGLFKNEGKKMTEISEEEGAPGSKISCFYTLSDGSILAGGSGGISKIKNGVVKLITPDFGATSVGTIRNINVFNNKIICAADGGLFEYKKGAFLRYLNLRLTSYSLKKDNVNSLWIGTEDGLFWSDGKHLKKMFLSDQPAANFINFIDFNAGKLYVGTNNGLYVLTELSKKTKAKVFHFGIDEGLINLETNINSSLIDHNGYLWFGTASGLVRFNTNFINEMKTIVPKLNIIGLKINFQEFDYKDYAKEFTYEGIPLDLNLSYTKNNIIVELDGTLLKNYPDLKYEYWLEGFDQKWTPTFNSPIVNLSNLPSGDYTLHIRAKNGLNSYSEEYVLKLRIKPVFYLSWWFITICIVVGIGLAYAYFNFRINRERATRYQESLEFKTKLMTLEQQSLNASMNRHFIFNSLNSIQYFINTQDKYSANKYLTNFAKLIRKNLDSSNENNNQVTLQQEIERLELYLSLEAMRFKDRFDYEIQTGKIDLEAFEVPAMLFQPFVENSIIHGILPVTDKKGLIRISLTQENDKIIVSIEDNGIGIENSMAKKGILDGDHRSQGMEITAKRISLLNKLSRQDYELEGPFQIEDENRLINGTKVLIKIPINNLVD